MRRPVELLVLMPLALLAASCTEEGARDSTGGDGCVELTFQGGFNGSIDGEALQCVAPSGSSAPVEAVPRSGFTFRAWSDGNTDNPRTVENPAESLTLTAEFATDGLTTVFLGHSFIRWNAELLFDIAKNDAGYPQHSDWMTFSGGAGGAPGSLWDNPATQASGQAMIAEQKPDNVVMTIHFAEGSSDYEDYANWVDYTLEHAPQARFYIALPWPGSPFGNARAGIDPVITEDGGEDLSVWYEQDMFPAFEAQVLGSLRTNYPDHDFIVIPQALAADEVTKAHFAGTLTVGDDAEPLWIENPKEGEPLEHERSIYDDRTGHPGGPLRVMTVALYLRYLYGVEVDAFDFWEDKPSFRNEGLEGIGPKKTLEVPYAYYNGFDVPAVADAVFGRYGRGE